MEPRGERIHGSSMFRAFCAMCGEPIRVPTEKRNLPRNFCLKCMLKEIEKLSLGASLIIKSLRPAGPPATPLSERQYDGGRFQAGEW